MANIDFQAVAALAAPEGPLAEQCKVLRQELAQTAKRMSQTLAAVPACPIPEHRQFLMGEAKADAARCMLRLTQLADCLGWTIGDLMAMSVEEIKANDPVRFAAVTHAPYSGG
jgi:hypothetical protein